MSSLLNKFTNPKHKDEPSNKPSENMTTDSGDKAPTNTPSQSLGDVVDQLTTGKGVTQEQLGDLAKDIVAKGQGTHAKNPEKSMAEIGADIASEVWNKDVEFDTQEQTEDSKKEGRGETGRRSAASAGLGAQPQRII